MLKNLYDKNCYLLRLHQEYLDLLQTLPHSQLHLTKEAEGVILKEVENHLVDQAAMVDPELEALVEVELVQEASAGVIHKEVVVEAVSLEAQLMQQVKKFNKYFATYNSRLKSLKPTASSTSFSAGGGGGGIPHGGGGGNQFGGGQQGGGGGYGGKVFYC